MNLKNLNEASRKLSDEKMDTAIKDLKNRKTFKYIDMETEIKLASKFNVFVTSDKQFMHIDIENPEEIIKQFGLELIK